ncbi:energy-coupling factor ABC transporter substrate-binding protein [Streptomonospora litoralis]|uniref:Cobalt transport protein CbiN n=1 Tax=Streptomonospora litoralis TaxID=2498135 RepID=A0A4P6Q8S5_9ACTN|nr:energy-coupling factor ABC transporter substrate-binding protein [Streptomonospora litoralis]QBI55397.1 Cobalt transport protein CbiN [Streptomonospora litoralis]
MPKTPTTWLLIAAAALIAVLPLLIGSGSHLQEPFAGADTQGKAAVTEIDQGYEPWFTPFYEPPSGEIESGIFALQAAIGAGIIGYYFGVVRTRNKLAKAGAGGDGSEGSASIGSATAEPDSSAQ